MVAQQDHAPRLGGPPNPRGGLPNLRAAPPNPRLVPSNLRGGPPNINNASRASGYFMGRQANEQVSDIQYPVEMICNYCKKPGHWKNTCRKLLNRPAPNYDNNNFAFMAVEKIKSEPPNPSEGTGMVGHGGQV